MVIDFNVGSDDSQQTLESDEESPKPQLNKNVTDRAPNKVPTNADPSATPPSFFSNLKEKFKEFFKKLFQDSLKSFENEENQQRPQFYARNVAILKAKL
ncbi:CLUMA_CG002950, isoform A [Clunio marinus]|uniref:CLUMA_CG002950, isoform A n=1 Tax=Clunio marinus TaxID=568069 RepID=A0A1J1HRT3_9DIPT|nr:CLUMA_CG002950, isoform A [Clunio marinus]